MSLRTLPMLALAAVACNLAPYSWQAETTGAASTSSSTGTATAPTTTAAATTEAGTSTTTSGATSSSFLPQPDAGPPPCDQWEEDCPEGQKCMPYSSDGDNSWDSLKCVDIVPNPAGVGEPCTAFGNGVSGEDTCDKHMMCWDLDPDTLMGTCVAMCIGSPDAPDCADPDALCPIADDGTLTLCFPQCDPFAQDCPSGETCTSLQFGFLCLPSPERPRPLFAPCTGLYECAPGLVCGDAALAVECDPREWRCCLPLCDLDEPACPGQGQTCALWPDYQGWVATFNTDVGLCQLPIP